MKSKTQIDIETSDIYKADWIQVSISTNHTTANIILDIVIFGSRYNKEKMHAFN